MDTLTTLGDQLKQTYQELWQSTLTGWSDPQALIDQDIQQLYRWEESVVDLLDMQDEMSRLAFQLFTLVLPTLPEQVQNEQVSATTSSTVAPHTNIFGTIGRATISGWEDLHGPTEPRSREPSSSVEPANRHYREQAGLNQETTSVAPAENAGTADTIDTADTVKAIDTGAQAHQEQSRSYQPTADIALPSTGQPINQSIDQPRLAANRQHGVWSNPNHEMSSVEPSAQPPSLGAGQPVFTSHASGYPASAADSNPLPMYGQPSPSQSTSHEETQRPSPSSSPTSAQADGVQSESAKQQIDATQPLRTAEPGFSSPSLPTDTTNQSREAEIPYPQNEVGSGASSVPPQAPPTRAVTADPTWPVWRPLSPESAPDGLTGDQSVSANSRTEAEQPDAWGATTPPSPQGRQRTPNGTENLSRTPAIPVRNKRPANNASNSVPPETQEAMTERPPESLSAVQGFNSLVRRLSESPIDLGNEQDAPPNEVGPDSIQPAILPITDLHKPDSAAHPESDDSADVSWPLPEPRRRPVQNHPSHSFGNGTPEQEQPWVPQSLAHGQDGVDIAEILDTLSQEIQREYRRFYGEP